MKREGGRHSPRLPFSLITLRSFRFPLPASRFPFPSSRFPFPFSRLLSYAAFPSSGLGAGMGPCMLLALVQAASFSALPLKRTR